MEDQRRKIMHDFYNTLYHIHVKYAGMNYKDEQGAAFIDAIDKLANVQIADAPDEDRQIFRKYVGILHTELERASYEREGK